MKYVFIMKIVLKRAVALKLRISLEHGIVLI